MGKFIPKNTNFGDWGAVSPHFKSDNGEIWREGTNLGDPPQPKFGKNRLRGYTPFWQMYTKDYQFRRFWGL